MNPTVFEQSIPCASIKHHGCEIYFVRHAQSLANIGQTDLIDSPLSPKGVEQAKLAEGEFDLVLCSPLRRCKETLHYSSIKYKKLVILEELREIIQDETSILPLEQRFSFEKESINSFWKRVGIFHNQLEKYCQQMKTGKILIVGHGFYFNGWYRRGSYVPPTNGEVIRLL